MFNLLVVFWVMYLDVEFEIMMGMMSKLYEGIEDGLLDFIVGKCCEGG